ncbi:MAG: HNH endonuclease signature motif containing protein [Candidatus Micrarchaeaceae archaeon]
MAKNFVNLDALIPREDFIIDEQPTQQASGTEKISIIHLEGAFFGPDLRKPEFQRETTNWTPKKVADLIQAFVDGDLIPAVILWRAGRFIFVIDGAHRLGALLAWIQDDYGDRTKSLDYCGGVIPDEQRKVATRTRNLVNKTVGSFQDYYAARKNPAGAAQELQKRLSNLSVNHIIGQWVPRTDKRSAEDSFFKINQSATPIDATEKRILKSRRSASAIAARAITHGGRGHKYWADFPKERAETIEREGAELYKALYEPNIGSTAISTLDLPVAGRGYNTLPFVFDLVNLANRVSVADSTAKSEEVRDAALKEDNDGSLTVEFIATVKKRVQRITGDTSRSLGIHPVVYFYTRGGAFQPTAFLAVSSFLDNLASRDKLKAFTRVRHDFEEFLIRYKEMGPIIHNFGSGERSVPWLIKYYNRILEGLLDNKTPEAVHESLVKSPDFSFLAVQRQSAVREPSTAGSKARFKDSTKTAAYFAVALGGGPRCALCNSLVHRNSVHIDHKQGIKDHGGSDLSNAQVTHPYCDSIKN